MTSCREGPPLLPDMDLSTTSNQPRSMSVTRQWQDEPVTLHDARATMACYTLGLSSHPNA